MVPDAGVIDIWGDGEQTRNLCHIDDCVEGLIRVTKSGYTKPVNLGIDELTTIDKLVEMLLTISGKRLQTRHDLAKPQGVRGRNSVDSPLGKIIGWELQTSLKNGLEPTYRWIYGQLAEKSQAQLAGAGRSQTASDHPRSIQARRS